MKNKLRVILIMLCILHYNTTEKIVFSKDAASGTVTFTLTAATFMFTTTDSKPFVFYNATYTFNNSAMLKLKCPFRQNHIRQLRLLIVRCIIFSL
jgi:hypothetical protein